MAAICIESDNIKSLKLLAELAEHLGGTVNKLSKPETKNLHAGTLVKKEKKGSNISNKEDTPIPNNSINSFLNLRKRIKIKMTNAQIDEQLKFLREEWQRDI